MTAVAILHRNPMSIAEYRMAVIDRNGEIIRVFRRRVGLPAGERMQRKMNRRLHWLPGTRAVILPYGQKQNRD